MTKSSEDGRSGTKRLETGGYHAERRANGARLSLHCVGRLDMVATRGYFLCDESRRGQGTEEPIEPVPPRGRRGRGRARHRPRQGGRRASPTVHRRASRLRPVPRAARLSGTAPARSPSGSASVPQEPGDPAPSEPGAARRRPSRILTVYAETSAVLRWLFNEPRGEEILEILRASPKVICSRLTLVESHRAIRRAVVLEDLTETDAAEVRATLAQASARWAVLEISPDVASRAEQAFPVEPVRTLDAVHLASALLLRHSLPELVVVSTDTRVRDNASQLGFEIVPPL